MGAAGGSTAELPPPTAFPKPRAVPVPTPFWSFSLALTLRRAQLLAGGIGRLVVMSLVETKITKVVKNPKDEQQCTTHVFKAALARSRM
ncbi:hypothetical protein DV515_00006013 [Chloebia gouldiae]|uniref:Uncharacterized protein n=1 Tax=Chloebia gouldiae TaxID=44316 RepID=A0A3L8SML8_CHLGU|nr:hypothetical protein DV515_00006013 [Chloebia gouldiae]